MFEYARRLQVEASTTRSAELRANALITVLTLLETVDEAEQFIIDVPPVQDLSDFFRPDVNDLFCFCRRRQRDRH